MAYPEDYPDDLTKAKQQGYLHKHMIVLVDPATGLPYAGGLPPPAPETMVPNHPGFRAPRAYPTYEGMSSAGIVTTVADTLYVYPYWLRLPIAVAQLLIRVTTPAGTASTWKAAVYANSSSLMLPVGPPLLVNNTGAATTTINVNVGLPAVGGLPAGIIWLAQKHVGAPLPTVMMPAGTAFGIAGLTGKTNGTSLANGTYALSTPDLYANNFPTLTGAEVWTDFGSVAPLIWLGM